MDPFPRMPILKIVPSRITPEDRWVRRQMEVSQHRMNEYVVKASLGKDRLPQTADEQMMVREKLLAFRKRAQIFRYSEHEKQVMFRDSAARTSVFIGGNQSGKTTALLLKMISWAEGYYPWTGRRVRRLDGTPVTPPVRIMIGAPDFANAVAGNIVPKMKDLIPFDVFVKRQERMQGGVVHKLEWWNGSEIKMMSYQMEDFAWEGYTWDVIGFDEPPPHSKYIAAKRGCVARNAPAYFSFTPISEPWIKDKMLDSLDAVHCQTGRDLKKISRSSVFVVNVDFLENPYITDEGKQEFWDQLNDEQRESRIHGNYAHLLGRVYKEYEEGIHVLPDDYFRAFSEALEDPQEGATPPWTDWPCGVVCDPHDRRPYAMGFFVVSPTNEMIFFEEVPTFDFHESRSSPYVMQDYADMISAVEKLHPHFYWYIMDPHFGNSPKATTGTTLIEEFSRLEKNPVFWDASFRSNDIQAGRALVKERLLSKKIFFLSRCQNFKKAMTNHTFQDPMSRADERALCERENDKFKDFPDLLRYSCEAGPTWMDPVVYNQSRSRNVSMWDG